MVLRLLSLPLRAPFDATLWIARRIEEQAMREYTDPDTIKRKLDELDQMVEDGLLSEAAFERLEEDLLERLRLARTFRD